MHHVIGKKKSVSACKDEVRKRIFCLYYVTPQQISIFHKEI